MTEAQETARGTSEVVELSARAKTAARRVAESKATIPHLYLEAEIDMAAAMERLGEPDADTGAPTVDDAVIAGCALALREHPRLNGSYRDGKLELHSRTNIAFAVRVDDASVLPTVFDADSKTLSEIAEETRALASSARDGSITSPELAGGTFTVASLSAHGISSFSPAISPPQAALLAVGEVTARPMVAADGSLEPRQVMRVTLACDHRIVGGAEGAAFLQSVRDVLEEAKWKE